MNTYNTQKLPLTPSFQNRSAAVVASLLITFAVIAGNLQLAQDYADATPALAHSAAAAESA